MWRKRTYKYLLFRFLLMKFDILCFKYKTIREWKLYHNHVAYVMEKKDMWTIDLLLLKKL
jgi:hypothetical protein